MLSKNACKLLGLIKFVNEVKTTIPDLDVKAILKKYPDVSDGLGCLEGTVKLQIDPRVAPVAHPPRKIPVVQRERLKELNHMERIGVIVQKKSAQRLG